MDRKTLSNRLKNGASIESAFTHKGYLKANGAITGLLRIN